MIRIEGEIIPNNADRPTPITSATAVVDAMEKRTASVVEKLSITDSPIRSGDAVYIIAAILDKSAREVFLLYRYMLQREVVPFLKKDDGDNFFINKADLTPLALIARQIDGIWSNKQREERVREFKQFLGGHPLNERISIPLSNEEYQARRPQGKPSKRTKEQIEERKRVKKVKTVEFAEQLKERKLTKEKKEKDKEQEKLESFANALQKTKEVPSPKPEDLRLKLSEQKPDLADDDLIKLFYIDSINQKRLGKNENSLPRNRRIRRAIETCLLFFDKYPYFENLNQLYIAVITKEQE